MISAHPDDEALGCAGTIIMHSKAGDIVHQLFISDGESSRKNISNKSIIKKIKQRKDLANKAAKIMGIKITQFLDLPDNKLDTIPLLSIIQPIEDKINSFKPHIIYTHSNIDLNIDHQIVSRAVLTACRPIKNQTVKEIYFFEVLSSTNWCQNSLEFLPNHFVDISKFINLKLDVLRIYKNEMRPFPHPRSIEGVKVLAKFRGMNIGATAAEAFVLERKIA